MADEQLLDVRPALASIDKLNKAFESVSSYARQFENAINNGVLNPLSKSLTSFEKTAKDADNLSKSFTTIADSINSAFTAFTKVGVDGSSITKLKSMVTDLSEIGKIDSAGNFANLSKSFQQLGSGFSALTKTSVDITNMQGNINSVRETINSFKIEDASRTDLSKTHVFIKEAVDTMTAVGKSVTSFNSAVKSLSKSLTDVNTEDISKKLNTIGTSINSLFTVVRDLFEGRNISSFTGFFNKKENVKIVELASSATLAMSSVVKQLNKLTPVVQALGGVTDYQNRSLRAILNGVSSGLSSLFKSIDGAFSGQDYISVDGFAKNKVMELAKSKTLALSKTIAQLNRLTNFIHSLKTIDVSQSQQIEVTLNSVGKGIESIFKSVNGLFAGKLWEHGSGADKKHGIIELAGSKTYTLKKVVTQVNSLAKMITLLGSITSQQVEQAKTNLDSIGTGISGLFTSIDGLFSGRDITQGDGSDTKYKILETASSKTLALKRIISNLGSLTKQVTNVAGLEKSIKTFITVIDKIKSSISNLYSKLGGLFSGKDVISTSEKGTSYKVIQTAQSKTLAMRNITTNLKNLCANITAFSTNSEDINKAVGVLNEIQQPIKTLFEELSVLSISMSVPYIGKDGKTHTKIVESVGSMARSMTNVVKALGGLATVTDNLSQVNPDTVIEKASSFSSMVRNLIDAFAPLGDKASVDGKKTAVFIDKNMQGFSNIMRAMSPFTTALKTLESVDVSSVKSKLPEVVSAMKTLITSFGNLGSTSGSGVSKTFTNEFASSFANLTPMLQKFSESTKTLSETKLTVGELTTLSFHIQSFVKNVSKVTATDSFMQFERLANAMDKVSNASKNLVTAVDKVDKALKGTSNSSRESSASINNITASFKQLFSAFVGGSVIYTIVRGIKDATKSLVELEYEMAAVNTIARASETVLASMTSQVLSMSSTWGVAKKELTKALYEINSATITGADAMVVLEASVKAARAGFTDVSKTAGIMSKIIKAYGYTAYDSAYISDVLFTTVERGINTMEQLSQYMGRVLTGAANAGVSFEEVAASIATMTTRGLQTNIATTALNSMILKLAGNSKKLNEVFQKYGYETSAVALRTLGLQKTIKILKDETQGHTDALAKLGFNYRDIRAATVLASNALSEYEKTMNIFKESANGASATERALQTVMETAQVKWDKLKKSVENYLIALQDSISANTHIKDALDAITKVVKYLTDAYKSSWREMTTMQTVVVTLTTAITDLLIISAVTSAFLGVNKAIKGVVSGISVLIAKFAHLIKFIRAYCRLMRKKIAVNMAGGLSLKALVASFKVATVSATAFIGTITAGIAVIGTLGYALYKANKEVSEFSKKNNISLDLGVQSSMDTYTKMLATKAGLLKKALRESIGKSTEEYNRAKENLLQFDAALQKLISSGKVSGSAFTGMSKAIQKLVSEADKNPTRKLVEGFEQFDNVVKQNESSITKLIDKIAQIDKTPVGKSFGAFEKYNKFADAQAGMLDVVERMEKVKEKFNALNVMSDGKQVTIDNAEAFLKGKGQANALSLLNKHVAGISNKYTNLLQYIPDATNLNMAKIFSERLRNNTASFSNLFDISKMTYLLINASSDIKRVRELQRILQRLTPRERQSSYDFNKMKSSYKNELQMLQGRLLSAGVTPNEYNLLESKLAARRSNMVALSKLGFAYDSFGRLSLKNKELQRKIGWNWYSSKDVQSNIDALSKAFSDFKGTLDKTESDLQTSITKMATEYKKHAEEFAKQLPKVLTEADKLAQGLFNANKKSLTLPEQIINLREKYQNISAENILALNSIRGMGSAEEAGRAMRKLITSTEKSKLPKLLEDISTFTALTKAQVQYKNSLLKQKDVLDKSLRQMKADKMADPISYYRSQFNKAFANVKELFEKGLLDKRSLDQFKEARTNYYKSLKQRVSYQSSPAMGQTQAIRAGSQEAQSLLARSVFATTYKTDEGILRNTKDVVTKTQKVVDILTQIMDRINDGGSLSIVINE